MDVVLERERPGKKRGPTLADSFNRVASWPSLTTTRTPKTITTKVGRHITSVRFVHARSENKHLQCRTTTGRRKLCAAFDRCSRPVVVLEEVALRCLEQPVVHSSAVCYSLVVLCSCQNPYSTSMVVTEPSSTRG